MITAKAGSIQEARMRVVLDEMIEMFSKIRRNSSERKRAFDKMVRALEDGDLQSAANIYRGEMPKPLKLKL